MAQLGIRRARQRSVPSGGSASAGTSEKRTNAGSSSLPSANGVGDIPRHTAAADRLARPAVDDLMATLYRELRQIAHHHLRRERRGHTLNTTALVNEAYVKVAAFDQIVWRDRAHFLAIAARAMRRVLIDYAIARKAQKRGGAGQRLSLDDIVLESDPRLDELISVNGALTRLEALNARLVRVVECRFFAGMSIDETADALELSVATVKRDWGVARAWLNRELIAR